MSSRDKVYSGKSKGMSKESIKNPSTLDNSFAPKWIDTYPLAEEKINGNCLRQDGHFFVKM